MKPNLGNTERMIRFAIGVALLGIGFLGPFQGYFQVALFAVGTIAIITAAVRFCPAWGILGINTCKR